ncbi:MAG TPA: hypothetical protein VG795_16080, partial [Acidimicrobiia bacterium]|nr:hypothetical protein [Acidimicrobiia bacterium]
MISVNGRATSSIRLPEVSPDSGIVAGILGLVTTLVVFGTVTVLSESKPMPTGAGGAPTVALTHNRPLAATLVTTPAAADPAIPPGAPPAL